MGRKTGLFVPYWAVDRYLHTLEEVEERRFLASSPTEHLVGSMPEYSQKPPAPPCIGEAQRRGTLAHARALSK